MAHTIRIGLVVLFALACESPRPPAEHTNARMTAAAKFTALYAKSRMANWKIRASASGSDCAVLFIETPIVLEDSMIEAMHYGAGAYDVYLGGVQQFCRDRAFRGVAYKDGSGRRWAFGGVTPVEVNRLAPCE
ncbi:MAG TPA: hypothetical protein VJZ00_04480 [Thermoanaerobaculia bacterium]|nr:hypothetical protein [Thermoanaerobaculia bacterium]